jgi:hypothetical protein
MIGENMTPGELYDNGGVVVVEETAERRAMWERLQHEWLQHQKK